MTLPGIRVGELARVILVAWLVHDPHEHLEADDGVDDDHKQDEESDVEQRDHRHHYGVQDHLIITYTTLIKNKIKFSLYITKFSREQLQSHIWGRAS